MNKKEKVKKFIQYFSDHLPEATTELNYKNAFQLTVAVILSAQCTDKRVNMITPHLFGRLPDPERMSKASVDDIFNLIKTCSYPRNKAQYLSSMSKILMNNFSGKIPNTLENLMKLPGVGRKTANVIASVYFGIPTMPVDTHVFRVSYRIGFTKNMKTPLQTELRLLKIFPRNKLNLVHHWLILHGRYVCKARNPDCINCGITSICQYYHKKHNVEK